MSIIFDKIAHTYTDDRTGEQLPSVNQIINSVYGSGVEFVRKDILEQAAKHGTEVHKDIEMWMNAKDYYDPDYIETIHLIEWLETMRIDVENPITEKIVSVAGLFAGTADLILNGHLYDYKTSKNKPTRKMLAHWQKQLSFYYFALKIMEQEPKSMGVIHLTKNKCTYYPLQYLGDKFVNDTYKAFIDGRKLEEPRETSLQTVDKRAVQKLQRTLEKIATLEKEIAPIREQIKQEMEKRGITALEIGKISVTYVGPGKRKKFDTERFKAENGPMYERYITETDVSSSIRIKVNGEKGK
jgi:peptidyl-tRNA hydrolase